MADGHIIYADAGDPGLRFILPGPRESGGLKRNHGNGHLGTIAGRGGSGKSILALQLVTELLNRQAERIRASKQLPHAAFYFTLEASPQELKRQISQFSWGDRYGWDRKKDIHKFPRARGSDEYSDGLYLLSIPSPVESLNALNLQIRQTIARQLQRITSLVAIVIDPMGAINTDDDLRISLSELKELAERHRTFVFLLTEKYAFEAHSYIEHYSQSIIHLEHDPSHQKHRRLYIQKARGQGFRSGYHQFELQQVHDQRKNLLGLKTKASKGIRVFPSIEAQSAYAHELLAQSQRRQVGSARRSSRTARGRGRINKVPFFPAGMPKFLGGGEQIEEGTAVFLMGPPGTFKEQVANNFAAAAGEGEATIYVSFKADITTKRKEQGQQRATEVLFDSSNDVMRPLKATTYFFDARSPLLTPEEVLFTVRNAIIPQTPPLSKEARFRRAIIWGLRRLYDFPNFGETITVQFLEALVTLLKSQKITSLLVDWPDLKRERSTLPIVDLCQYIFLSRVCYSKESPELSERKDESKIRANLDKLWGRNTKQLALLRAQRTRSGIHHDYGVLIKQSKRGGIEWLEGTARVPGAKRPESFEYRWLNYGAKWEEDLSLRT